MRSSLRIMAVAAALIAGSTFASAQEWTTIRVGTDATYPPFESQDASGAIIGFDIDVMNAICEELKVTCIIENTAWDGIIPALVTGKIDAIISSMSITAERLEQIDFTDKVYNTPAAIVAPSDSDITGSAPADVAGKILGAQVSTTHASYIEQMYPDAELRTYPTADEYKLDLASGRIDGAIDDIVVLNDWLATEDGACCKMVGTIAPVLEIHGAGAGIGVRKEDTALKDLLNQGLAAIIANGKYKEINDKYFDFNAYGS